MKDDLWLLFGIKEEIPAKSQMIFLQPFEQDKWNIITLKNIIIKVRLINKTNANNIKRFLFPEKKKIHRYKLLFHLTKEINKCGIQNSSINSIDNFISDLGIKINFFWKS